MDRFCHLKRFFENILTRWCQNNGHVIKYQTVHLNILVLSHSLMGLFFALSRICNPEKCVLNKQLPRSLQWSFAFEGSPSLQVIFCDLRSGGKKNPIFSIWESMWKHVKSFFSMFFLCKKFLSVFIFTQFHKWYLCKKYTCFPNRKKVKIFFLSWNSFFIGDTVSGMLIQQLYTDSYTGIPILGMVCLYHSAGIPLIHDSMCQLRLLYQWKKVINDSKLMKELTVVNMANVSPATSASQTNQKQKPWANQPKNTYCQVFFTKSTIMQYFV